MRNFTQKLDQDVMIVLPYIRTIFFHISSQCKTYYDIRTILKFARHNAILKASSIGEDYLSYI